MLCPPGWPVSAFSLASLSDGGLALAKKMQRETSHVFALFQRPFSLFLSFMSCSLSAFLPSPCLASHVPLRLSPA